MSGDEPEIRPPRRRTPAVIKRTTSRKAAAKPPQAQTPTEPDLDPAAADRAEKLIGAIFLLSAACTVGFCIGYVLIKLDSIDDVELSNYVLGLTMTGALGFLGLGLVLWTKKLMPHFDLVEDRHPMPSSEEDREEFAQTFNQGLAETGLAKRPILRRSLLLSAGLLGVLPLFPLRDMGPLPQKKLRRTRWTPDVRLVDTVTGQPIKVGDIEIGGLMNVMPEGVSVREKDAATSPSILIRLRPGENVPAKGRETWAPEDYVCYNKICTHAGCPIGLYEQQKHLLFCPCHQSTFNVLEHCRVTFGPAARSLPQLPIYIDKDGYFRATSDFTEPVGPSFWERG